MYGSALTVRKGPDSSTFCDDFKGEIYFQKGVSKHDLPFIGHQLDNWVCEHRMFGSDISTHVVLVHFSRQKMHVRIMHPDVLNRRVLETGMNVAQVLTFVEDFPPFISGQTQNGGMQ